MYKTCYIINFYLGSRRCDTERYQTDNLCYVKSQVETLEKYKHNISKIIFNFNVEKEHFKLLSESINLIPKNIQNSEIEINIRDNYGMSYGAWSDMFVKYKNEFDYYIFNEDDYFFVQDNFDEYLINKFNSLPNCGYLAGLIREQYAYGNLKCAGMSTGISSFTVLKKVFDKYGELPHSKGKNYYDNEIEGQINQTHLLLKLGYEIYDIREEYKLRFWGDGGKISNYFFWNDNELIIPGKILYNEPYVWYDDIGREYLRMECDYNSKKYFEY